MVWQPYHWISFCVGVAILLFLDLFVFHKDQHADSIKKSALWTGFWCSLALAYNYLIYLWAGKETAIQFLTGYLVEWSLSMDNVFVFAVVFSFFKIPLKNQHRVLFWGILGAVVMRFIFIFIGSALLQRFDWVMAIFGALLVYTGIKLLSHDNDTVNPNENLVMKFGRRFLRVYPGIDNERFFVKQDGKLYVTSLFLVLMVIESTDVLFAVDSVPAIFGITRDPFIVFTSNIAAILGLRSLYFMLAGVVHLFKYLNYGLSAILVFVGVKMNLEYWMHGHDGAHIISPTVSLIVIVSLLALSILASLLSQKKADLT